MSYQIFNEAIEYTTSLFKVRRINLAFPDGKARDYHLIDIQNAVTILPVDDEGIVHFVRQYRIGARSELLELPAGKIETGEDPLVTAQRELREETGFRARNWDALGGFYMTPGYANEYMHCFLARGLYRDPLTPDVDEFLNLVTIPLQQVFEMVRAAEIEDSKSLAVLMLSQRFIC